MKIREFDGGIERSVVRTPVETKRVVRGIRNRDPKGLFSDSNRLLRVEPVPESIVVRQPKAAKPRLEETAPTRPPEVPVRLIPLGEGRYTFETVTHDLEVFRDKSVEAVAEYLATLFLDPAFDDATEFWHIESDPATETVDAMEGVSGWLQLTVDMPLKGLATKLGLSPDEAAVTAGVSTDLILAPITGPLNKAESFIEAAGIIVGLLTGGHVLVLACAKLLLHNQAKRLAVRGAVKMLTGSQSDRPRSNARGAMGHNRRLASDALRFVPREASTQPMPPRPEQHDGRPPQVPASQGAPVTRRQPTPSGPLWLCLAVVSEPLASTSAANPAPATTARKPA